MKENHYGLLNGFYNRLNFLLPKRPLLRYLIYVLCLLFVVALIAIFKVWGKMEIQSLIMPRCSWFLPLTGAGVFTMLIYPLLLVRAYVILSSYEGEKFRVADSFFQWLQKTMLFVLEYMLIVSILLLPILLLSLGFRYLMQITVNGGWKYIYWGFGSIVGLSSLFFIVIMVNLLVPITLFESCSVVGKIKLLFKLMNLHKIKLILIFLFYEWLLIACKLVTVFFFFPMFILIIFTPAFMFTVYKNLRRELMEQQKHEKMVLK